MIGYGLMLLPSVFVDALMLICSILVVKCIAKIMVHKGLNNEMVC